MGSRDEARSAAKVALKEGRTLFLHKQPGPPSLSKHNVRRVIRAELSGLDCSALGISARGHTPVLSLCRALVAAGYDKATPLEVWRGCMLALRVKSIGKGALLAVEDNRHGRPRFRLWRTRALGCGTSSPVSPSGLTSTKAAVQPFDDVSRPNEPHPTENKHGKRRPAKKPRSKGAGPRR
jgi:hypothetical protein